MNELNMVHKYVNKCKFASDAGNEFELSFAEFKRLMNVKTCKYTKVILTTKRKGMPLLATDRTLDRIDNRLGYISGNVVAASHFSNQLKGQLENPSNSFDFKHLSSMCKVLSKMEIK